jgi:hypothetical protein
VMFNNGFEEFREGALYRTIGLATIGALLVGCAEVKVRVSIGAVNYDELVLQAIAHALAPGERTCPLELAAMGDAQQVSEGTDKQMASVKICGRLREFSIQRSSFNADGFLIVAKKI